MRETSPYEGGNGKDHALNGRVALGTVVSVDSATRRCRVKTAIGIPGVNDDLDGYDCRLMNFANHSEGDEACYIPRIGCYVLITFLNSMPFIIGYFQSMAVDNDTKPDDKEALRAGDYIFKTKFGNRLIMRSGGSIELESTKMCRVYLLPQRNLISAAMDNFEIATQGGQMTWGSPDDSSDATRMRWVMFDDIDRSNVVEISSGTNADGSIFSMDIGPGGDDLSPTEKKFHLDIKTDGTTTLQVGKGVTFTIAPSGDVTLNNDGKLGITSKGGVSVTTDGAATVKAKSASVDADSITIKSKGNTVPGQLVTDNEQNEDPITGIPLIGNPTISVP